VELLNGAWNNDKLDLAPNVKKLTTRFNNVSQWCATTILYQERLKNRVAAYSFFVLLAKVRDLISLLASFCFLQYYNRLNSLHYIHTHSFSLFQDLFDLHNFNSMMAIIAGLNKAAISRLKYENRSLSSLSNIYILFCLVFFAYF
jgi:hypothetical protein